MKQARVARPHLARRALLLGAAAALAVSAASSAAIAAGADPLQAMAGTYRFVGGDVERKALHDAIEDVVQGMSSIARPIARARLQEANPVPEVLSLRWDGRVFRTAYARESYAAPIDGTPTRVLTQGGDAMLLALRLQGSTLRQRFSGEEKSRTNLLRIEGERLAVYVQVHASALPKDLAYRLTYAREP